MHKSSYRIMEEFSRILEEHFDGRIIKILDVGSYGINGTYREIFSDGEKFCYTGLDVNPGPNVDYVPADPYVWTDLPDQSFDVVISGQAFEHIEFPWLIMEQIEKKLKEDGLVCIVAPSRGPEHKYPVDCWRYYPDGFRALAKWAGLNVMDVKTFWGLSGFADGSDQWGDTFCVLHKKKAQSPRGIKRSRRNPGSRTANRNNPLSAAKGITYYSFAREEVIDGILKHSVPAQRVLEIGCASGATGKRLKEKIPVNYYAGVDISPKSGGIARKYLDKVIVGDIEQVDLLSSHGMKHGDFDLLLLLDVLEHLYDPWEALAGMTDYVRPGGYVVASVPNVQNVTVVNNLLKGRWEYENAGILDATHLRFFTLDECVKLFSGAGLSAEVIAYVMHPPVDMSTIKKAGNTFQNGNVHMKDLSEEEILRMFSYQYIIYAKKTSEASCRSHQREILNSVFLKTPQEKGKRPEESQTGELFPVKKECHAGLVSIVMLTFNELSYTKECVESIRRHTPEPHEIVFVDNGSTDGTVKWLQKLVGENPHYRLIENNENLGFAKGCNQGMNGSSAEYILLLNNDVVVTEGWLAGMLEAFATRPETGIVGPMTNSISGIQKDIFAGHLSVDSLDGYAKAFRERNRCRRISQRRIAGFCMLFKRELIEKVGLLDEAFGSGNFEDDDLCLRAWLKGYENVVAGDVFIYHYGSRSFTGNKIDYNAAMARNREIFSRKWNGSRGGTSSGKELLILRVLEKADEFRQKGKIDAAVDTYLKGIGYAPDDKKIYYALATMLLEAKEFKAGLDTLNEMPQEADDPKKLILKGYCKEGLKEYAEAEEYADKSLSLDGDAASAFNLKGVIAFGRTEISRAEKFFLRAIECDPGFGDPYANLGVIKWSGGRREEALDILEKGFILAPTTTDIAALYHSAAVSLKCFERGVLAFREAKALHPGNRSISLLLIDLLIGQGMSEEALQEIQEAMIMFGADDGILSAALELKAGSGPQSPDIRNSGHGLERPHPVPKTPEPMNPSVSLCMIVKNEEQHLAKCLMSVKHLVDEMIVVDTGSTDRTRDIAKVFGAKVYDFEWTKDFSEARNFSLSKASGKWIIVLDADEVISPSDHENLRQLIMQNRQRGRGIKATGKTGTVNHTGPFGPAYSFVTRNYVNNTTLPGWTANKGKYNKEERGSGWVPSKKVRLFPNDGRIRFENPVHELVEASLQRAGIKIRDCTVPVHHYGKLVADKVASKGEDYYQLGKKKLEEKTGDAHALSELAIQAAELKRYDESLDLWRKVIGASLNAPPAFLSKAYSNMGGICLQLRRYEDARSWAQKSMEINPKLNDAFVTYALCELVDGDVKRALSTVEDLLGKIIAYPPAEALLSALYCIDGKRTEGLEYINKMKERGMDCAGYLYDYAERLASAGKREYALSLIDAAVASNSINKDILTLLPKCAGMNEGEMNIYGQNGQDLESCASESQGRGPERRGNPLSQSFEEVPRAS